ncbi:COPIA protein, partial [Pseudoatta argentina]
MFGMILTNYDPCIYSNSNGSRTSYVDDGLITGQSKSQINKLLSKLNEKFETTDSNKLISYSDADFATYPDTRNSRHAKGVVATSMTDAEYVAAHDVTKEVVWAHGLLKEIGVVQEAMLNCDNAPLITNNVFHRRTKYIDIKFHFVYQEEGQVDIRHVMSEDQLADIFIKSMTREKFRINRGKLGIV